MMTDEAVKKILEDAWAKRYPYPEDAPPDAALEFWAGARAILEAMKDEDRGAEE